MSTVEVTITGLDTLVAVMNKYPAISEKYVNKAINRSLVRVLGEEKVQAPVHTGNLRDNWTIAMGRFEGSLASNAPYAAAVHNGSVPHMPPVDALKLWCSKKGIDPWALARAIQKRGTRANPFLQRAVDNQTNQINGEFRDAINGILQEIANSTT